MEKGNGFRLSRSGLLRAWIDQGAKWPAEADAIASAASTHWAYKKPERPALPKVKNAAWPRNEIDLFVLARLEKEGLTPQPEVDRARLIRRVSLDLIGLPPTIEEVDAFLADKSPDAYDKVVDRLLSSPHYGERWARPWLDLARYADTNGYEKDSRRVMWPYRDWVINALNKNMPFDEFTIEQLAGDLLPNATLDQKIATGFHRNTMINAEGGVDPEEYRVAAVIDRVNTTATVWLGTTLGCCQCHSHKYDPFKQKDYYQFMAFFNNTADIGPGEDPKLELPEAAGQGAGGKEPETRDKGQGAGDKNKSASEQSLAGSFTSRCAPEPKQEQKDGKSATSNDEAKKPKKPMKPAKIAERPKLTTLVMQELPKPRVQHLFVGGSFLNPGEVVSPGVPAVLNPFPAGQPPNRLGLAKWLVDPANPLTARVADQSHLGAVLRHRHCADDRRFRHERRAADASGAARLAGHGIHSPPLGLEGDAQADRHVGDVSTIVARDAGAARARSAESLARPRATGAARGRTRSRSGARRERALERQNRRAQRHAAAARRHLEFPIQRRSLGDRERRGSLPPRAVHLLEADVAVSFVHEFRRTEPRVLRRPPPANEHAAASARAIERSGLHRGGASPRSTDGRRIAERRPARAARARLSALPLTTRRNRLKANGWSRSTAKNSPGSAPTTKRPSQWPAPISAADDLAELAAWTVVANVLAEP